MKKSLITTAVLLGISTIAMADEKKEIHPMSINADGLGQVLLYPYYTVKDGFDTAFTLVNTTETHRAVKVRIIEGKNSWEVFDFNLYMSPHDTWQGMLHAAGDKVEMLTSDKSCTRPRFQSNLTQEEIDAGEKAPDPFFRDINLTKIEAIQDVYRRDKKIPSLMYALRPDQNKVDNEGYDEYSPENILKRMSEGYIEVIDMGAIVTPQKIRKIAKGTDGLVTIQHIFGAGKAPADATEKELEPFIKTQEQVTKAIEHKDGVADCKALDDYAHEKWSNNPDFGIYLDGKNALTGTATLINVSNGVAGSYNAVAIKNFVVSDLDKDENVKLTAARAEGTYTLHNEPGASYPNLNGQVQRKNENGKAKPYYAKTNPDALVQKNGSGIYEIIQPGALLYEKKGKKTYKDLTGTHGTGGTITPNAISLTAILMAKEVIGEYYLDDATRSASDMVITMPTKHYFTNADTSNLKGVSQGYGSYGFIYEDDGTEDHNNKLLQEDTEPEYGLLKKDVDAYMPFSSTAFSRNPLYEPAKIIYYDREEQSLVVSAKDDFSPSDVPNSVGINAEANVLQFSSKEADRVFDSINAHNVAVKDKYKSGWVHVTFEDQFAATVATFKDDKNEDKALKAEYCEKIQIESSNTGNPPSPGGSASNNTGSKIAACLRGLPVIGISATKYVNSILYMQSIGSDVLSNYLGIVDTAYKRDNTIVGGE